MKALQAYVDQENRWSAIFGGPKLDLRQASDRQLIASSIDAALSPELLTCDGELTRSQVQAKYNKLIRAAAELKLLDPNVIFYEYDTEI
jgi:hypothetical protein